MLLSFLLAPLLFPAPPARPAPPQEADPAPAQAPARAVEYFQPRNAPVEELGITAQRLFAGQGGITQAGFSEAPPTVLVFGGTIVVRDVPERIGEVIALLRQLDEQWSGGAHEEPLQTLDYRARYVTLESLSRALSPFQQPIVLRRSDGKSSQTSNMSFLEERGTLVARGTAAELAQIRAVVERIDVPQPQVLLTCYLVEGAAEEPEGSLLPKALTDNLAQLVPYVGFRSLAMGILRSDALARMTIEVDFGPGEQFQLELHPRAYAEEGRALTFERCAFGLQRLRADGSMAQQQFTTSARVRVGEYIVLGALGAEPVFVVLHVALVQG